MAVEREPYTGPVVELKKEVQKTPDFPLTPTSPHNNNSDLSFHSRPPTRSGGRHMQDSSFSLSGRFWGIDVRSL